MHYFATSQNFIFWTLFRNQQLQCQLSFFLKQAEQLHATPILTVGRTLQLFMKDIQVPGVIVTPLHNQEAPLNLVQWADDDALSAEAPPDSAVQGPTGSGGVLAGERDGPAEPMAGVGDGVHRLERREPGGGGAAALRQGRQAAAVAFGLHYSRFSLECEQRPYPTDHRPFYVIYSEWHR